MIKKVKAPIPLEEDEQKALVQYLELKKIKFTAIPNSTYTKSWKQKINNKAMGLRAGLPDMLICLDKSLLFIEMKRNNGSKPSEKQVEWIDELNKYSCVDAIVCNSFEEAVHKIKFINKYYE